MRIGNWVTQVFSIKDVLILPLELEIDNLVIFSLTMPTSMDPKFKTAGKTRGLEIWRVNKFDLEVVPKEQFGNFYSGDSYIILNVSFFTTMSFQVNCRLKIVTHGTFISDKFRLQNSLSYKRQTRELVKFLTFTNL